MPLLACSHKSGVPFTEVTRLCPCLHSMVAYPLLLANHNNGVEKPSTNPLNFSLHTYREVARRKQTPYMRSAEKDMAELRVLVAPMAFPKKWRKMCLY